ncbi:LD-carboxypeptidase [Aneurinibacillus sp. Ricciae_BoGa-3]|uniref:S66 peptidase family protein n=1 Tax=Aneurinibacillus sp. Ricciae_BoGa-3 TaxID=3022697 RepID=UPI0023401C4B|nr:LD-carboxypeptidase [Aneurinibacillus sp. Ricciae_BoGa-3]WCK54444.1 LD-carboxypeptidase [Aneurinibacillus sp. Ricciae_BoGa-3]
MATAPPLLRKGDTIGIVTPGSPLAAETINARIATVKSMGFNVVLGKYVYEATGFLAGTPEQRASDLMSMFENKAVKMILPTRGGVGVQGILPFLDYGVIRNNPKIITGYSDDTILLNVLNLFTGLITFQSLLLIDFRPDTPEYNFSQFFTAVTSTASPRQIQNPPGRAMVSRVPGNVIGPLVGGNLTSFVGSLGTPYEIDTTGRILLIEETHAPINTVYRYLLQLKTAGKFDECLGIIMGECTGCEAAYGVTYNQLIDSFVVPLGKPLLTNVATAHGRFKAAMPIGATVNLNADNATLTVLEPTVSS